MLRLDLTHALAGLTVEQRAIVVMRYLEDRPVAEVATVSTDPGGKISISGPVTAVTAVVEQYHP